MTANGLFIFALQASFVLGFAVLGPLAQTIFGTRAAHRHRGRHVRPGGPPVLDRCRRRRRAARGQASLASARERRGGHRLDQLRGGPRLHPRPPQHLLVADLPRHGRRRSSACWACSVRTSPKSVLDLEEGDFVVVVLPLGAGLVCGILVLNLWALPVAATPHRGRHDRPGRRAHHPRPRPGPSRVPQRRRQSRRS